MFKEKRSYYILIMAIILTVSIGFSFIKSPTDYNLLICYIVAKSIFGLNLIATTVGLYFYKFEKNMDDILYSVAGFLMLIPFYINLFDPTKTFSLILAIAFIVVGVSSIAIAIPFCLTTTWKVKEKALIQTYHKPKTNLVDTDNFETVVIEEQTTEQENGDIEIIDVELTEHQPIAETEIKETNNGNN